MRTEKGFNVSTDKPTTLTEQETIITYDKEADEWHFYSDNPVHCKRWEHVVVPSDVYPSHKRYHSDNGSLIALDGKINGSVSVREKRKVSEAQKAQARKNIMTYHEQNRL